VAITICIPTAAFVHTAIAIDLFFRPLDQVTKLINHYHNIGHVPVSLFGVQTAFDKLFVIFLDGTDMRLHQQLITVVHLFGE
jgi:hypothetical protein